MLLNSVILLLREVLEAAILASVLLALSAQLRQGWRWLLWALPVAMVGTFWFAGALDRLTDAMDGTGQEVANASLQLAVYVLLVLIIAICASSDGISLRRSRVLRSLMATAVGCAMIREGSEIVIYITAFAAAEEQRTAVYAGSAIGSGIGLSLGVLLYYALRALPPKSAWRACLVLLLLIGTGMVMQATMLLEQVDWLPSGNPVWNSSALVSEQSLTGELLYAVFGYEASPSPVQVLLYLSSMAVLIAVFFLAGSNREGSREDI